MGLLRWTWINFKERSIPSFDQLLDLHFALEVSLQSRVRLCLVELSVKLSCRTFHMSES